MVVSTGLKILYSFLYREYKSFFFFFSFTESENRRDKRVLSRGRGEKVVKW
jgi:hypothetical protein